MPNKNVVKGNWAQKVAADFARLRCGFDARVTRAGYEKDYGDVHLNPFEKKGAIIQVKNVVQYHWSEWLSQTKTQAENADAEISFVLNKRPGQGEKKVGDWLAVMRYEDLLILICKYQALKESVGVTVEEVKGEEFDQATKILGDRDD